MNIGDGAVATGSQLVLHLHRFDDDERLSRAYGLTGLDEDPNHFAGHRRKDALRPGAGSAALFPAAPPSVAGDGHRRGADVHRQLLGRRVRRGDDVIAFSPHVVHQERQRLPINARRVDVPRGSGVGSTNGRPCRACKTSSRYVVWNVASTNSACASNQMKNGTVVLMPATRYSPSARRMRAMARGRSSAHATSFEIIGS